MVTKQGNITDTEENKNI